MRIHYRGGREIVSLSHHLRAEFMSGVKAKVKRHRYVNRIKNVRTASDETANSPCMDSGEAGSSLSIRPSASLPATKSATRPSLVTPCYKSIEKIFVSRKNDARDTKYFWFRLNCQARAYAHYI